MPTHPCGIASTLDPGHGLPDYPRIPAGEVEVVEVQDGFVPEVQR